MAGINTIIMRIYKPLFAIVLLSFLNACTEKTAGPTPSEDLNSIRIAGSESELPLVQFLTKRFLENDPDHLFVTKGGGSTFGIDALLNGDAEIAAASRPLLKAEKEYAEEKELEIFSYMIAQDVIAVITHKGTGVEQLSLNELQEIYSGKITNWSALGGYDLPIKLHGRDKNSGTRHYMLQRLMMQDFPSTVKEHSSYEEIIATVISEPGSIAYVNVGSLVDRNGKPNSQVWTMNLYLDGGNAYSPYEKHAILNEDYPLLRPLYLITTSDALNIRSFLDFCLQTETQNQLMDIGYYPINEVQREINKQNDDAL